MFRSLLKSIKRYAIRLCCYADSVFFLRSCTRCLAPLSSIVTVNSPCLLFPVQILDTHNKVEEKKKLFLPYNILPLDPESTGQAIMRYPEVLVCRLSC